jgi:hypothetical protein
MDPNYVQHRFNELNREWAFVEPTNSQWHQIKPERRNTTMMLTKVKLFAQTVGFVTMTMLILYGAISFFTDAELAFGAPPAAPAQQAATSKSVPPYLSYQGTLRDAEGKPISGVHKLTFRIYDDVTDPLPDARWMEEHAEVTVRNGQFSVLLGNTTPVPPELFSGPDRFIGVTLDGLDEMVPRQRFASAPFAMYADHAVRLTAPNGNGTTAVHVDETGRVGIGTTSPQAQVQISSTASNSTALQVNGNFSANTGNALLAQGGGRVGIATDNPLYPLHVGGQDPDMMLDIPSASAANRAEVLFGVDGQTRAGLIYDKTTGDTTWFDGQGYMTIDDGGNNLIGPRLNVNGDLRASGNLYASANFYMGPGDRKPIKIVRIANLPENTSKVFPEVPASDYECTIGSWSTGVYDISEDSRDADKVWAYVEGGWWWVAVKFMSDGPHEKPAFDVVCFLKGMVEYETKFGTREHTGG